MAEFDLVEKAILGTGGAGLGVMFLFKLISFIKKEQVGQAGDNALKAQFELLQEQIKDVQADNKELRIQFNLMDVKLHRQQTKLTRTEMLLRQFCGLVEEHGITIPKHMSDELNELLKINDQPPTSPQTPTSGPQAPFYERRKDNAFLPKDPPIYAKDE